MSVDHGPEKLGPLVWVPNFEVGASHIDDQHRVLLGDINELTKLLADERSWSDVIKVCRKLHDECVAHFRDENALLQGTGYDKLATHLQEHRRIEELITVLLEVIENVSEPSRREVEAALFMRSLLVDHFFRHDIAYKSHVMHVQGR